MKGRAQRGRAGQSLIEASLVLALACLIFFGLFQISQLFAAKHVLTYAAAAGARAEAVGFNGFMVYKVIRAAAIPNAGRMTEPVPIQGTGGSSIWGTQRPGLLWTAALRGGTPRSSQLEIERSRIPLYLGTTRYGEQYTVLNYERWDEISDSWGLSVGDVVFTRVRQNHSLVFPFRRAFYANDHVVLQSAERESGYTVSRGAHSDLYLE
jgi:hypothetical protein